MNCPKCGQEMKLLTVKKEGKNKGRKFWGCPDRSCDGFEWANNVPTEQEEESEMWDKKDQMHCRQTAWNVVSTIYAAMIEAGLTKPTKIDIDALAEKVRSVEDDLYNGDPTGGAKI